MNRTLIPHLALAFVLAACTADGSDPIATETLTPSPGATATADATVEPTLEPTPSPTLEPSASASLTADGRFFPAENAEADALFLERDECQNLRDGYQLVFPDDWYTNTEFREVPPCSWFSPTFYEVDDGTATVEVPEEIAITIVWMETDFGFFEDPIRREDGMVGGQTAVRIEFEDAYMYSIQLGPTFEEGPNLIARTARDMGGDYELNKAVLDRLMLTIEFIGSVQ
jgi:hypothetical protein